MLKRENETRGNPKIKEATRKDYYRDKVVPKWDMIAGWARNGLSNAQISRNLGIGESTFCRFMVEHEELQDWMNDNRENHANIAVENALFKRAVGYEYEEVTKERREIDGEYKMVTVKRVTKQVAPDVNAATYWLEHRAADRWPKVPDPGVNADGINQQIQALAALLSNPAPVREIGSENE